MSRGTMAIVWHDGPRAPLRHLFDLADDSPEQIDSYIELGRVLVALDDTGKIIGHAQLLPTDRDGTIELKSIAVVPELQRRRIGLALIERVLAVGRGEGARAVTVTTATADLDNVRFYQRCGFRVASIERDAFTEANGYPAGLEADGIPVRDGITFTFTVAFDANVGGTERTQRTNRNRSAAAANVEVHHSEGKHPMITKGIIVRLKAKRGQEETVAGFLRDALPLVQREPQTIAWFALRIDASSFAIVDVFPDEAGRRAHLDGVVAAALAEKSPELLAEPPAIEAVDVIAAELPRR